MNRLRRGTLEPTPIFVEIRQTSFHVWTGDAGVDLPLERGTDGRLLPEAATRATTALLGLIAGKSWLSRARVQCAISSHGVLLRSISLPAAPPGEVSRLLRLQIESEFPLPPEALAWGWMPLPGPAAPATGINSKATRQELLVAVVKREVIEEYAALLEPVDSDPVFTLAALARVALVPTQQQAFSVLDVGSTHSELTVVGTGAPPSVQLLPWGENHLIERLVSTSELSREEARTFLTALPANWTATSESTLSNACRAALNDVVAQLMDALPVAAQTLPLWIAGSPVLALLLGVRAGASESRRALTVPSTPGHTAATLGLKRSLALAKENGALSRLALSTKPADSPNPTIRTLPRGRIGVAAALLLSVFLFPYLEALFFQPRLARRLGILKAGEAHFAAIDRELSFFRYFEQNQAPHLDAIYVIAQAAPPGAHLDSVSMTRQGGITLTGYLRDLAQIGDFRLKLINSAFFSTVVAEDQSPTPDRQRVNFRITAQWKAATDRELLSLGPLLPDAGPGKTSGTNGVAGSRGVTGGTNGVPSSNSPAGSPSTSVPPVLLRPKL